MLIHVLGDWMSKQCDLSPSGSPLVQLHHSMDTYISLSGLSPCKGRTHGSSTLMTSKVISVQSSHLYHNQIMFQQYTINL